MISKRFISIILITIILLLSGSVYAAVDNNNKLDKTDLKVVAKKVATDINKSIEKKKEYDANTISGYFMPSCVSSHGAYVWYYRSFVNQCPFCYRHNLLINPKGVYESEITCGSCDADFCGVEGRDKNGRQVYLTPA